MEMPALNLHVEKKKNMGQAGREAELMALLQPASDNAVRLVLLSACAHIHNENGRNQSKVLAKYFALTSTAGSSGTDHSTCI